MAHSAAIKQRPSGHHPSARPIDQQVIDAPFVVMEYVAGRKFDSVSASHDDALRRAVPALFELGTRVARSGDLTALGS
jgi:aminoglycoside phosphotransferase (APT) family kinase protein